MSSALALASVTAVLKDVLSGGFSDQHLTDVLGENVTISAMAPDAIQLGSDIAPRLNLYLHQVTHNAAWRNVRQPVRGEDGELRANAPLALDLHYLVTAYAPADLQAEVMLGCAMLALHTNPVLPRALLRKILNPSRGEHNGALPGLYEALRDTGLAEQIEQIKIVPTAMSNEELSRLWSAFQAHYRPSVAYQVTVVLIEAATPARSPLPVLRRGPIDPDNQREMATSVRPTLAASFPEVTSISYPRSDVYVTPGENVQVNGHDLTGSEHTLTLNSPRFGLALSLTPPSATSATSVGFDIPSTPSGSAAGTYFATLKFRKVDDSKWFETNTVALTIAPLILTLPDTVRLDSSGSAAIALTCKPNVLPGQRAVLILNDIEGVATPTDTPTSSPQFKFKKLAPGRYQVRLQVDGIDSPFIDRTTSPPSFNGPSIEVRP